MARKKQSKSKGPKSAAELLKAAVVPPVMNSILFAAASGRDAAEVTGATRPGPDPVKNIVSLENKGTSQSDKEATRRSDAKKQPDVAITVPDEVRERFIQIGNNFYFADGAEAFTHHGNRITTRSENAVVVQGMVAIARAEGRNEVTVEGTERFRKEAWFAASRVGITVRGYTPTEFEREHLVRAVARRAPAGAQDPVAEKTGKQKAAGSAAPKTPARHDELIRGRLVDHGPAHYQHNPREQMSYFVRLETPQGDRDIWGVDLERAMRQSLSTPGIGDEVGVRALGSEAVTVLAPKRDHQGREVGQEEKAAHRNQWMIERADFLDRRREMSQLFRDGAVRAYEAIKQFPELEGSYLELQMARAFAEQQYSNKVNREGFVEGTREQLARKIELGQPLEPVRLREGAERVPGARAKDRDHAPTR